MQLPKKIMKSTFIEKFIFDHIIEKDVKTLKLDKKMDETDLAAHKKEMYEQNLPFIPAFLLMSYLVGGLLKWIFAKDIESDLRRPGPDTVLMRRALEALAHAKLDIAWHKGFGSAAAVTDEKEEKLGLPVFTAWGSEVHSEIGSVGTTPGKRVAIAALLMRILIKPRAERQLVERALSLISHPASHRREVYAFAHRAFKWLHTLHYGRLTPWPADIRGEIFTLALSMYICHGNMRWPISTRISTTDATCLAGGATSTTVSRQLSQGCLDSSLRAFSAALSSLSSQGCLGSSLRAVSVAPSGLSRQLPQGCLGSSQKF